MLTVQKTFPLDFGCVGVPDTVFAKAGDKDSRILIITPTRFASVWQLPPGVAARLSAKRPDGGKIYNDCEITDDGKIKITLTDAVLAVPGKALCEIVLFGADGEICSSEPFTINVTEGITKAGHELPAGESTAAENIILKLTSLYNELLVSAGGALTADSELSADSVRPVQNKAIKAALDGHTHPEATPDAAGFMSAADKAKLDSMSDGTGSYVLPVASYNSLGGVMTTSEVSSADGLTPCPIISGVPYYAAAVPDSDMSDTSENAVSNKTVKAYIDALKAEIETAITGGAW